MALFYCFASHFVYKGLVWLIFSCSFFCKYDANKSRCQFHQCGETCPYQDFPGWGGGGNFHSCSFYAVQGPHPALPTAPPPPSARSQNVKVYRPVFKCKPCCPCLTYDSQLCYRDSVIKNVY